VRNFIPEILAVILVVLAVLGLIHQQLTTNDVWVSSRAIKEP